MADASTLHASVKGRPAASSEATAAKQGRPLPETRIDAHESARIDGGITAPLGFTSAALHCGIKAKTGALDLTVDRRYAAGFGGRPVHDQPRAGRAGRCCRSSICEQTSGLARAVVINSGCANACTGSQGLADAETMAREAAAALGCTVEARARGVHGRDRRQPPRWQGRARHPRRDRSARARQGQRHRSRAS